MPSGAKPGERRGGRTKGTPQRAAIAIEEISKKHGLIVRPGQKLVKDDMIKVFEICLGMAARYQPSAAPGGLEMATAKQLAEFKEWIRISIEAGKAVMPYQSPTFRAIVVAPAPDLLKGEDQPERIVLRVFEGGRLAAPIKQSESNE